MIYITRRERFSSAHQLINPKLDIETNKKLFSKCHNLHGHNYELFVTVSGKTNKNSGFVIDLKDLKELVQKKIIQKLDHHILNEVDFMKNKITTTENLCLCIWEELELPIQKLGGNLHKLKITETENNYFEYFGENN
tara:strand:- start:387 stop:797 length:411 start_codon:yes stop_codon:yes gene_type:complete